MKIQRLRTQRFAVLPLALVATALGGCVGSVQSSKSSPSQPSQPLSISATVLPGGQVGQSYQGSMTGTGGTPPYHWTLSSGPLPSGLTINSASGLISGQPVKAGTFSFGIELQDSSTIKASAQSQMSMQITAASAPPATLQISTSSLPDGAVGQGYAVSVVATGGTPPYHWSIPTGSLPTGLSLSATSGLISGQPTASGSSNFVIGVQDAAASRASAQSSMSIQITAASAPPAKLQISTSSLPSGQIGDAYAISVVATGGTAPYHWSVPAGSLPTGLSLNATSGLISGQPTASGSFDFVISVQDAAASKASAQSSMSIQIAAAAAPAAATSTYYGPGIGSDGLGNTTIGPNQNKLSYRIRVQHTGYISSVQPYLIMDHAGYWGGTSGQILVSVQTDDGSSSHHPSGQKLTSSLLINPDAVPVPARYFPTFTFSGHAAVTGGEIYHIVFENPDPNPAVNYVSVDALYQAAAPVPSQPTIPDTDCAVLLFSNYSAAEGTIWKPRQGYAPIVQMNYDDGFTEGFGYMEVWVGAPQSISGSSSVREAFTVSEASRAVSSVGVRVARLSGSGALTVRLETGDGTLIEQGDVAATSVPLNASATYVWATYKFSAPHTLSTGQSYHLVLQSPVSTIYQAFPIRKGSNYGYKNTTFFADGYAQFLQAGSWVGWTQWGVANRKDGDLQFYFAP
jgi:hypothetical protein